MTEIKESTWFIAMIIIGAVFVGIIIGVAIYIQIFFPQCKFGWGRMLSCIFNVIWETIGGG